MAAEECSAEACESRAHIAGVGSSSVCAGVLLVVGCKQSCEGPNMCPVVVPSAEDAAASLQIDPEFAHQLHLARDGLSHEIDVPDAVLRRR